jgi:hypothetical protein
MNCANHPETPVAAYCQFCGKPLCAQCAHKINNIVGCEPCLAARVAAASSGDYGVNIHSPGFSYTASGPLPPGSVPTGGNFGAQPWVAFCLGWIPGVGAMYNGQFAKAMVHVFVFAILLSISNRHDAFGIVVAAWMFYQVFDAYQTAAARRDGLPLPNPLGLNDVGQWFGVKGGSAPASPNWKPYAPAQPTPASPAAKADVSAPFVAAAMPPVPPDQMDYPELRRGIPTGAVALIVIGLAFLLGNMGILSDYWMERGWPLILIAVGIWLVIRRTQTPPGGVQ